MVLGYHITFTAYGFWLSNDPRGSWSDFVGAWELLRFGRATKTNTRRSLSGQSHDLDLRQAARRALKYPAVRLTGIEARTIAQGFADLTVKTQLTVWACSILPQHVHMVIARHRYRVEHIVNQLKGASTKQINNEQLHPLTGYPTNRGRMPKMWARGHWKVFLNAAADIRRAIRYVENNPVKEGKQPQRWRFVQPFETPRAPLRVAAKQSHG